MKMLRFDLRKSKYFLLIFFTVLFSSNSHSSEQMRYDFSAVEFDKNCQSRHKLSVSGVKYDGDKHIQLLRYPGGPARIVTTFENEQATTKIKGQDILSSKTVTEFQKDTGLFNITVSIRHVGGVCSYFYQAALQQEALPQPNSSGQSTEISNGGLGAAH